MADRISTFVHWLLAELLHSPTCTVTLQIRDGRIERVTEEFQDGKGRQINIDNPFLSEYMPRPRKPAPMVNHEKSTCGKPNCINGELINLEPQACEECLSIPCICFENEGNK